MSVFSWSDILTRVPLSLYTVDEGSPGPRGRVTRYTNRPADAPIFVQARRPLRNIPSRTYSYGPGRILPGLAAFHQNVTYRHQRQEFYFRHDEFSL